jgi:NAD(P)-dependent dehydrogenase (short-subunit alcohol dehydrogenase family)
MTGALVTGAAAGIGRASAVALAAAGAAVVIADLDEDGGRETVRLVEAAGGRAQFVVTDVASGGDVRRAVETVVDNFGSLDWAVNNAGVDGAMAKTGDYDEQEFQRVLGINLIGVFLCMRYEIPHMLESGAGAIVNVASVAGLVGFPSLPAYVAAKHGVVGLTRAAALDHSADGLRINAICPGGIRTALAEGVFAQQPGMEEQLTSMHPIARLGTPDEVGRAVAWLCSDAASFITGTAIPVDGGWTTH